MTEITFPTEAVVNPEYLVAVSYPHWDTLMVDTADSSEIIVRGKKAKKYAKWLNKSLPDDIKQMFPVVIKELNMRRKYGEKE